MVLADIYAIWKRLFLYTEVLFRHSQQPEVIWVSSNASAQYCHYLRVLLTKKGYRPSCIPFVFFGRGEKIRTSDPLHPMQVRYQAALRPEQSFIITALSAIWHT